MDIACGHALVVVGVHLHRFLASDSHNNYLDVLGFDLADGLSERLAIKVVGPTVAEKYDHLLLARGVRVGKYSQSCGQTLSVVGPVARSLTYFDPVVVELPGDFLEVVVEIDLVFAIAFEQDNPQLVSGKCRYELLFDGQTHFIDAPTVRSEHLIWWRAIHRRELIAMIFGSHAGADIDHSDCLGRTGGDAVGIVRRDWPGDNHSQQSRDHNPASHHRQLPSQCQCGAELAEQLLFAIVLTCLRPQPETAIKHVSHESDERQRR